MFGVKNAIESPPHPDYKLVMLADGNKLRMVERSAAPAAGESRDVFAVPDELRVLEALGVILGKPSLVINSVRVLHLPRVTESDTM